MQPEVVHGVHDFNVK